MCYAKPGPRCTAHAKKALVAATVERDTMMSLLRTPEVEAIRKQMWVDNAAWKQAWQTERGEYPTREQEREWIDAQPYEQQYGSRAKACHPALADARDAYDATPGGIADMKAKLAALEEHHGDAVLTVPEYVNTQGRLAAAQKRRADQLAAFKEVQAALGNASEPEPSEAGEDEASAAAPAPPCACIEYRYQGDCSHLSARIAKARATFIPTSHDASLGLHAARSRRRAAEAAWEKAKADRGLAEADSEAVLSAMTSDADLNLVAKALDQAAKEEFEAENAFFGTPAGVALLHERIERRTPCTGYGPHFFGGWSSVLDQTREMREQSRVRFEEVTGQPAGEFTDDHRVPDLMYGANAGCAQRCKDFAWSAKCVHTDAEWASAERIVGAITSTPEFRAMDRAMSKAFAPKKPGLLSRLRGR